MSLSHDTLEKIREKYAELQMQQALAQQQQAAYTTSNTGNVTLNSLGAYTTTLPYQSPIPIEVPQHNLNEGAWDVPISQLVDLWTVRYGSKWVNEDELDEFYQIAAKRLRMLHKLEQHYVNGSDVYRIVE